MSLRRKHMMAATISLTVAVFTAFLTGKERSVVCPTTQTDNNATTCQCTSTQKHPALPCGGCRSPEWFFHLRIGRGGGGGDPRGGRGSPPPAMVYSHSSTSLGGGGCSITFLGHALPILPLPQEGAGIELRRQASTHRQGTPNSALWEFHYCQNPPLTTEAYTTELTSI